ncbi:uncharacterized protein LOC134730983 isoform X2 [Pan paniscus]|uniref:uncharacterized protein LOC134730983 isoform X2 n=1 Tax=Pan paniscus TaxID=9597 RepID=UPI003004EA91
MFSPACCHVRCDLLCSSFAFGHNCEAASATWNWPWAINNGRVTVSSESCHISQTCPSISCFLHCLPLESETMKTKLNPDIDLRIPSSTDNIHLTEFCRYQRSYQLPNPLIFLFEAQVILEGTRWEEEPRTWKRVCSSTWKGLAKSKASGCFLWSKTFIFLIGMKWKAPTTTVK